MKPLSVKIFFTAFIMVSCSALQSPVDLVQKGGDITLVSDTFSFTEGPAADRSGNVYFTDQPNDKIYRWDAKTGEVYEFLNKTGRANGTYFNKEGELITCSDEKGEIWDISPDKKIKILSDGANGRRFNGPNDLWIDKYGGIYFTDPLYLRDYWKNFKQEIPTKNLYFLSRNGSVTMLDAFQQPNGIVGSNKFHKLYVSDIDAGKTFVYDIEAEGVLKNKKLFCNLGSDGMTMDNAGNIYLTGDGVTVFSPAGKKIYHISVPEKWTSNLTFAGKDFSTLFITASKSIYTVKMNVKRGR